MESDLRTLQEAIVERLQSDSTLSGVAIMHQDVGNIGSNIAQALTQAKGAYMLVMILGVSVDSPTQPGPYFDNIGIRVETGENYILNRTPRGTNITALQLAERALSRLHHWTPPGSGACLYASKQAIAASVPPKGSQIAYIASLETSDGVDNSN